ncbi:MAG: hypothetical protein AAF492_20660, partial [Verrucomicrobiota bacterium]
LDAAERNAVGFYLENKYGLDTAYFSGGLPVVELGKPDQVNMADNVTTGSVDVVGNVVSTGASLTVVRMLYDTVDHGTNVAAWGFTNLHGSVGLGPFTTSVSNLMPGTKYFFRYLSTNSAGTVVMGGIPGFFVTVNDVTPPIVVSNGLVVWFEAGSLGGTNGTPVCAWPNLVTNPFIASQSDPDDQPSFSSNALNGQPAVCFNNANGGDVLFQEDFASLFTTSASIFVVAEISGAHNYTLFSTRHNDPRLREGGNTRPGAFRTGRVDVGQNQYLMPVSGAHIFNINSSAAEWTLRLNGDLAGLATPQFNPGAGFLNALGGRTQDGQQRLNGCIAEVLIYDRILSPDEQQIIGGYLEEKYGLDTAYENPDGISVDNANGATGVTASDATLHGTLTATGSTVASVSVFWGLADGGTDPGAWAHRVDFGAVGLGPLSTPVGGLTDSTPYFYRFFASNNTHQVWTDSSESFVTDLIPADYTRRLKVQLCGFDGSEPLTNFPVLVILNGSIPGFDYADF